MHFRQASPESLIELISNTPNLVSHRPLIGRLTRKSEPYEHSRSFLTNEFAGTIHRARACQHASLNINIIPVDNGPKSESPLALKVTSLPSIASCSRVDSNRRALLHITACRLCRSLRFISKSSIYELMVDVRILLFGETGSGSVLVQRRESQEIEIQCRHYDSQTCWSSASTSARIVIW